MPTEEPAARDYRVGIANLLTLFRTVTDETRDVAEQRMGLTGGKLGRWERAEFPPKAFELATLYKGYEAWGMEMEWLIWPPDLPGLNVVREKLTALALAGTIAADEAEARAMVRRLRSGTRLASVRGRRSA